MAVIPVYNMLLVPNAKVYFKTSTYAKVSGRQPTLYEKTIFLIRRQEPGEEDGRQVVVAEGNRADEFYEIGVTGTVTEVNKHGYVVIDTDSRVNIDQVEVISVRMSMQAFKNQRFTFWCYSKNWLSKLLYKLHYSGYFSFNISVYKSSSKASVYTSSVKFFCECPSIARRKKSSIPQRLEYVAKVCLNSCIVRSSPCSFAHLVYRFHIA